MVVKEVGDKIEFSVRDNGIGFDEIIIKRGNGLNNMQKRAEEIGALFNISSTLNQGTRLKLIYKLTQ